jgi:hypothetical protein
MILMTMEIETGDIMTQETAMKEEEDDGTHKPQIA